MATFQKRGSAWRAQVRRKGQYLTQTFDTRAQAEQWATRIEARLIEGESKRDIVTPTQGRRATVVDLFERYAQEVSPLKRGGRWEGIRLRKFGLDPAFAVPAANFTAADMADWRDARLKEVSGSSVNRDLNLISAVFTRTIKEWRIGIVTNPVHMIQRPKSNPSRRQRIDSEAAKTLATALEWDQTSQPSSARQWAAYAFILGLHTAMRKGEILSIVWRNVHLAQRFIHLDETKNGESRDVPLSKAAVEYLRLLKIGKPDERLIPLTAGYLDKLMREARIATGLKHIRFHDARHEATTQIAKKLSNVLELGAVTGHRDLKALRVYFNPKASELAGKLD